MIQITELKIEQQMWPLLRQAFRPMFLLGAGFSAFAIAVWLLILAGIVSPPVYGHALFWHSHEMLFGFVAAIVVGFLLTAVQNWTGLRATHGNTLAILTGLWLAGRLVLLIGEALPAWLVIAVDLAFLPVAAVLLAIPLIKVAQQRNLFFVPVLLLLTLCNALMHYGLQTLRFDVQLIGSQSAVWLVTLLMAIVGGRVIPMFTANGTLTPKAEPIVWLDRLALGSLWLIMLLALTGYDGQLPRGVMAGLSLFCAATLGLRCWRWKIWLTWRVPLLWSLHLAYWFIPFGLVLFGLRYLDLPVSNSTALHALTAGAMGSMILAMIARVSLGHSGRPLQPHPMMSVAFALVLVAALLRVVLAALWPQWLLYWYVLAGVLWVVAFVMYLVVYWSVLTTPRADGRPG